MTEAFTGLAVLLLIAGAAYLYYRKRSARPVPEQLREGKPLPEFVALDEAGNSLNSEQLRGTPVVMIFVRGNWCPFCSRQVKNLTASYKNIVDLGAKLIFVTPKPLETTRRVAGFFDVEFEFWLDESLAATRQLGLLLESGVPKDYYTEYGSDTIWPTSLVIGADGIIRYVELSKHIIDRPNPKTLLRELQKAIDA
ncbi:MAG: redoxin domain-containing protein [Gammaproteobacteria bacterium]|jgi:peroxiredoxin|nr:redoxin domain-containing protein [Gammaproteobacteria bacterium]MDH3863215.1 redoxin domain-containing protein [Gammaproteobacteria bacterium]MDH3904972.1 redoxin domain-containing protein [Gammaproteobacteria bacterium]MDH3908755.1 redoxin domain-containing protein [Gammaproteobacteria bacterium]MDH3953653.1 redoxin domain-containing protein [Gammaproteobacteria bacterium]